MLVVELIRRKRDGGELTREEIEALVSAYTRNAVPDYQMAAFLMASVIRGLSRKETAALTNAMLHSGQVLSFSGLDGPKVDKHSTGGVGDKTSLILAPLAAAGGLYVPMISGRGLGHTGGTLDKLEAIPSFNVNLSLEEFRRVLGQIGCAMIGQTAEVAPADKKLYALRDVTGTVESPHLICASIMSKKLAEGVDGLVLDVKTGSGAFMKNPADAEFLARLMVETGEAMGKRMVALLTDMDQPLGRMIGNALEVEECVNIMQGKTAGSEDLCNLTLELAAWMFYLGKRTPTVDGGRVLAKQMIDSGAALAKFREMVRMQGGDEHVCDDVARLPKANRKADVLAPTDGFVHSMECERMGFASLVLGGGRLTKEDAIDPSVGMELHKKTGDAVHRGESLCTVYYNEEPRLLDARRIITAAYKLSAEKPALRTMVQKIIEGN